LLRVLFTERGADPVAYTKRMKSQRASRRLYYHLARRLTSPVGLPEGDSLRRPVCARPSAEQRALPL
jgi:hypothetical protein